MAKTVINPEAELPPRPQDGDLSPAQLALLGVFASLKRLPPFATFPGTWVLRYYREGEVICRQGDAGGTAFYLLTRTDIETLAAAGTSDADTAANGQPGTDQLRDLLGQVRDSLQRASQQSPSAPLQLASARLLVDTAGGAVQRPLRFLQSLWRRPATTPSALMNPSSIPNDGPAEIDYKTRQAPMYEGEVFGEISCMTRQPRSATVIASTDCFVLEFLRNILEKMHKDEKYNEQVEKKYRERVLELHLRQLSIFRLLSADEFNRVKDHVELVKFPPGTVIWDEGDDADALYVVRNGIVQVLQSFPWRMTDMAVLDWPKLWKLIGELNNPQPAMDRLRKALPKPLVEASTQGGPEPTEEHRRQLLAALNELAKTDALLTAKETQDVRLDPRYVREKASFPAKEKNWTGLQRRRANRVLFHILFTDAVAPAEPVGGAHVLEYLGRGGILGEIAVMLTQPRSATCVAYAHADADREATDVELVRVSAATVLEIAAGSNRVKAEMKKLIEIRTEHSRKVTQVPVGPLSESRRADELGMLQGQNLMLIDLDRCTRCGDCVQACIDTHNDGHSRLFLDGPRFGKYLMPSSCRQCRDPVCMIGCPVGSIQQGPDGEIRIRDWCIGCGLCADQCPYDSIQMHEAATIPTAAPGWLWIDDASDEVGSSWNRPNFPDRQWRVGTTPFSWGIDLHLACTNGLQRMPSSVERLYFRYRFRPRPSMNRQGLSRHRLLITSQGTSVEAYLNGQLLELKQDAAQKKRSQFACEIKDEILQRGEKVLAIVVAPPKEFGATVLDARIDTLAAESEEAEEKLVTKRAVVCDQCSSLSGDRHACVYACPHEAAMRIDAWQNFPEN